MDREKGEREREARGEGWEQKIRREAEHEREFKNRMRVRGRDKKTYRMEKRGGKRGRLQAFVMRTKRATMITQQHIMQHSAAFRRLNTGSKRC